MEWEKAARAEADHGGAGEQARVAGSARDEDPTERLDREQARDRDSMPEAIDRIAPEQFPDQRAHRECRGEPSRPLEREVERLGERYEVQGDRERAMRRSSSLQN